MNKQFRKQPMAKFFTTTLLAGLILLSCLLFNYYAPKNVAASLDGFEAGNIMSDAVMSDKNSMSVNEIQAFLKSKNSCNDRATYKAAQYPNLNYSIKDGHFVCMADENFNGESAAKIIWQTSQDYNINPQVLIVLLEKEQGLVTDTWPNHVQYQSATGYGCPDTAPCDSQYFGLKNQLRRAAALFREVLDGGWSTYPVGDRYIQYNPNAACGGSNVNIQNRATSALYRYTPYQPNAAALAAGWGEVNCGAYGNRNFYNFFTSWFGSTRDEGPAKDLTSKAKNYLVAGEQLLPGEFLTSPNGNYILVMQYSGQLVLYANKTTVWQSSPISWDQQDAKVVFQDDGNLVIYKNSSALWSSGTNGKPGDKLALQDDGNVVIRTAAGAAVWASDSNQPYSPSTHIGDSLLSQKTLSKDHYLRSSDWRYFLIFQQDGNLVLYTAGQSQVIWASNTAGKGGKTITMQTDGNLVMYGDKGPVWASNTAGKGGTPALNLQPDGNLVIYQTTESSTWASNTAGKGGKTITMQTDGNLVMYGDKGAVWASNTAGKGGKTITMQTDGNLVMYGDKGPVWASETDGKKSSGSFNCTLVDHINNGSQIKHNQSVCANNNKYQLLFQDDGNLVLYTKNTASLWSSDSQNKFFKSNLKL